MELIQDELTSEQIPAPEIKKPCSVCKKNSPYQCPKCKWFYCCLKCYQKHNLHCTEEFYKENVIEHLKGKKVSQEETKKMQNILDHVKKTPAETEVITDRQQQRFEELLELLESGKLSIEDLSPEELQNFSAFIGNKENLHDIIREWQPWWENEDFTYNLDIEEMNKGVPEFDDRKEEKLYLYRCDLKEKYNKLPPLDKLIQINPSPELIYHIVQFTFGCAYLCREYNGDLKNCADTVVPSLIAIAKCLVERASIPTLQISLDQAMQNAIYIDGTEAEPFLEIASKDLVAIFGNRFYLFELCFRFYDVVHRYYESLEDMIVKEEKGKKDVKKLQDEKKKVSGLKQKLIFYMAFLKKKTQNDLDPIREEIKTYVREKMKNEALHKEMEKIVRNFNHNIRVQ